MKSPNIAAADEFAAFINGTTRYNYRIECEKIYDCEYRINFVYIPAGYKQTFGTFRMVSRYEIEVYPVTDEGHRLGRWNFRDWDRAKAMIYDKLGCNQWWIYHY